MKKAFLILVLLVPAWLCVAQEEDSTSIQMDTLSIGEDSIKSFFSNAENEPDNVGVPDSAAVTSRSFGQARLDELKADPTLQYKEPPTIAESLWDRFWNWIGSLFRSLFKGAFTTDWGQVVLYILGTALVVFLVLVLLKVDGLKIFFYGRGAQKLNYQVIDENIHEMDFEKLIQQAVQQKDYRRGVRLVFLYSLKMLSDANHITWEQGKTNHDYVAELKAQELKGGFSELSVYFEYAWYGNFAISGETFGKVQGVFSEWRGKVK